ncbi:MAG: FHA domain-containing protein [Planctomycetota bacterium]
MLTLIQLHDDERRKPATYHLDGRRPQVIGRRSGDVTLTDSRVSRRHAEVSVQNGVWVVRDLDSSNGTWVNGDRVEGMCELEEGDRMQIGRIALIVGRVEVPLDGIGGGDLPTPASDSVETAAHLPDESSLAASLPMDDEEDGEPASATPTAEAETEEVATPPTPDPPRSEDFSPEDVPPEAPRAVGSPEASGPRIQRPESPLEPLSPTPTIDEPEVSPDDASADPPAVVGLAVEDVGDQDMGVEEQAGPEASAEDAAADEDDDRTGVPIEAAEGVSTDTHETRDEVEPEPAEPDMVEPESEGVVYVEPSPRWGRRVAAVLVLAATAGVAGWAIHEAGLLSSGDVAGRETDATPPLATADTALAEAARPTPTPPAPRPATTPDSLVPLAPTATPDPVPSRPDEAYRDTTADAFGRSPTLELPSRPSRPAVPAPSAATTPAATEAAPVGPADPASVEETPAPRLALAEPPSDEAAAVLEPTASAIDPAPSLLPPLVEPDPEAEGPTLESSVPEAETVTVAEAGSAGALARRVVYLVDTSGSMVDSMNQGVLTWLNDEIEALPTDDRFAVVFFRSGEVFEAPPAGLKSAGSSDREAVLSWVKPGAGNIRPRGRSEPLEALRRAAAYEPTDLVVLSDDKFGDRGNRLAPVDERDFEQLFDHREVKVHTVQFFYRPDDERLRSIAERFGGTYEFVPEPPFDAGPAGERIDLLGVTR